MSERRYIVTADARNLASTRRPPTAMPLLDGVATIRFFTAEGRWVSSYAFRVTRGVVAEAHGLKARETTDPDLVAKIDAARIVVEHAAEKLREAQAAEQEVLAMVMARAKPVRVSP